MKFIYGLNINGQSLLEYFYSKNISVLIWDDNIKIRKQIIIFIIENNWS